LNDYSFFSAPQLKRIPLGGAASPMKHSFELVGVIVHGLAFGSLQVSEAQEHPPASRDTTRRDTVVVAPNHGGMLVVMAAVTLVILSAPGPFASVTNPDTTDLGFADSHWATYVTGGPLSGSRGGKDFWGWAYSASIEVLTKGVYAELRTENFHIDDHVQFWTMRGGYLFRPKPAVAGGVTIGYRFAGRSNSQRAVEVGFPLVVGSRRGWMRFEPTYVISSQGVSWNYRWQSELPVSRSFFSGVDFDVKPVRQHAPYFATMTLLLGWRH
jgi:hypothetical protein